MRSSCIVHAGPQILRVSHYCVSDVGGGNIAVLVFYFTLSRFGSWWSKCAKFESILHMVENRYPNTYAQRFGVPCPLTISYANERMDRCGNTSFERDDWETTRCVAAYFETLSTRVTKNDVNFLVLRNFLSLQLLENGAF